MLNVFFRYPQLTVDDDSTTFPSFTQSSRLTLNESFRWMCRLVRVGSREISKSSWRTTWRKSRLKRLKIVTTTNLDYEYAETDDEDDLVEDTANVDTQPNEAACGEETPSKVDTRKVQFQETEGTEVPQMEAHSSSEHEVASDDEISQLGDLSLNNKTYRPYRDAPATKANISSPEEIRSKVKKTFRSKTVAGSKGRNKTKTTKKKEMNAQLNF
jgi:hypothetical protein